MKKITHLPPNRCLIWHRWELKKDTVLHKYHECKDCGARKAQQISDLGYQPIDNEWVIGLKNEINNP